MKKISFFEWLKYKGISYWEFNEMFLAEKQKLREQYFQSNDIIETEITDVSATEEEEEQ